MFRSILFIVLMSCIFVFPEKTEHSDKRLNSMFNGEGGWDIFPEVVRLDTTFKELLLDDNIKVVQIPTIKSNKTIYRAATNKSKLLIVNNSNECIKLDTASIWLRDGYVVLNDRFGNYVRDVVRMDKIKIMILYSAIRNVD